ncbi:MAG: hypothetical protein WC979_03780 [Candidatus Pacearchaeota archaeon]|jgi:hypothetical protein
MENSEETIKKRKDKIKGWFKNPYNLTFFAIILFAIAIRFYYFWLTKNQPIWWDESEYMSQAKAIAGLLQYDTSSIRSPIFPAFMSIFFFLGITSEPIMRFLALFIPSVLVIVLTYFMIKEMYLDKRIALISTILVSVLWEHLFYSNRFHTENFALIFQFLALFILFRCYIKSKDFYFINHKYSLIWILLFSIVSMAFRPGNVMFIPALLLLVVLLNKDKLLTKSSLIIIGLLIVAIISAFIFTSIPQNFLSTYTHFSDPIGWNSFNVFYGFYESPISYIPSLLFYGFLIGLAMIFFRTVLVLDNIKTFKVDSENLEFKSDLFNLLLLFSTLFVFVFIMRANSFEYRWFFPLLPAMLAFTGKGIIEFSEYIGSFIKSKYFVSALIILIVILGAYSQMIHADQIIKFKVDSYSQVRDAALWIKDNYPKNTQVLSISYPQTVYYSERNVSTYSSIKNSSEFNNYLASNKPAILEVSIFESHPEWLNSWINDNKDKLTPINAYFADKEQTQPVLVLYRLGYNNTSSSA